MCELHRMARAKLGRAAGALKTRGEIEAALGLRAAGGVEGGDGRRELALGSERAVPALVTRDFFLDPAHRSGA